VKNRKSFILIITFIPIVVSIFLGFYAFENGWRPDRFYNGIKGIDWIMITAIILIILLMAFIIISFLFIKRKHSK